ncbi:unnamed protein product, partial [Choristocarpus tenellus]
MEGGNHASAGEKLSRLAQARSKLEAGSEDFFYRLGVWVATHSFTTLAVSMVLVILCMLGFANFTVESAGGKLWTPADSRSKYEEKTIRSFFHDGVEINFVVLLFTTKAKDGNVLTKAAFDELWITNNVLYDIKTDSGNTFLDLCEKESDGVTCRQPFLHPMHFWSSNYTLYQDTVSSDADILMAVNTDTSLHGNKAILEELFGNTMVFNETTGDLISAQAISQ